MEKGEKWKINRGSPQSPLLINFHIKLCNEDIIVNHDVGCKIEIIIWNASACANDVRDMSDIL